MVDSAPRFVSRERGAGAGQGDGGVWCGCTGALRAGVSVLVYGASRMFMLAHEAAGRTARCSLCSQPPRAGATRPYPRTPARGKLSLQAFARCARVLRFAQGVLCWRTERPTRVRAGGALLPRCSLRSQPPRAGAARPYPRTPTRGKLSLQAFARCRARAALRAGVAVLAHGATRRVVLAHAATRPCALARATTRPCVLSLSFGRVSPRRSAIAPRLP